MLVQRLSIAVDSNRNFAHTSGRKGHERLLRGMSILQGYLTHKKLPPPLEPLWDPRHRPVVGS